MPPRLIRLSHPNTGNIFGRVDEGEIEKRCDELRSKLLDEMKSGKTTSGTRRQFKEHQVHEMADAKIQESERLRKALKISSNYEEGGHWKRQEDRLLNLAPDEADRKK